MATSIDELIASNPHRLVGLKQVVRGISEGMVWCVIVSQDSDAFVLQRVMAAIEGRRVGIRYCASKAQLGAAVGIDVAASVVGLCVDGK